MLLSSSASKCTTSIYINNQKTITLPPNFVEGYDCCDLLTKWIEPSDLIVSVWNGSVKFSVTEGCRDLQLLPNQSLLINLNGREATLTLPVVCGVEESNVCLRSRNIIHHQQYEQEGRYDFTEPYCWREESIMRWSSGKTTIVHTKVCKDG